MSIRPSRLKAVLLHNSTHHFQQYERFAWRNRMTAQSFLYDKHPWNICGKLYVVVRLSGSQN